MAEDPVKLLKASEASLSEEEADEALKAASKALALFLEAKNADGEVDARRAVILARLAGGDLETALEEAKSATGDGVVAQSAKAKGILLLTLAEVLITTQDAAEGQKAASGAQAEFKAAKEASWEAKAVLASASAQLLADDAETAIKSINSAVGLFREAKDKEGEATAHQQLAIAGIQADQKEVVDSAVAAAIGIYKELGDKAGEAFTLLNKAEIIAADGPVSKFEGDTRSRQVKVAAEEALDLFREVGHKAGAAQALAMVLKTEAVLAGHNRALTRARTEADACRIAKDKKGEAAARLAIFEVLAAGDDTEAAVRASRRALDSMLKLKNFKGAARVLHCVAVLRAEQGYWELSIRAAKDAMKLLKATGGGPLAAELETIVATAYAARGEDPPSTAARTSAMGLLTKLSKALEEEDVEAFEATVKKMRKTGGVTDADEELAFADAFNRNPEKVEKFVQKHLPPSFAMGLKIREQAGEEEAVVSMTTFRANSGKESGSMTGGAGVVQGDWDQTQGQIELRMRLSGAPNPDNIEVQMKKNTIKIFVSSQLIKAASGDLFDEIWVKHSWWDYSEETETITLHFYKRQLKTWNQPWYDITVASRRRTAFPWRPEQSNIANSNFEESGREILAQKGALPKRDAPELNEDSLQVKPRGAPEAEDPLPLGGVFAPRSDKYIVSPDDLCLGYCIFEGYNDAEFLPEKYLLVQAHFEKAAFDELKYKYPLELAFGVEIGYKSISMYLQGDRMNPILKVELAGLVVPEATVWMIRSCDDLFFRGRQQNSGFYSPMLEVRLQKDPSNWGVWGSGGNKIDGHACNASDGRPDAARCFTKCMQYPLMIKEKDHPDGPQRFTGLRDADTLRKAGYDLESEDYWGYVEDYVKENLRRNGCSMAPRPLHMIAA